MQPFLVGVNVTLALLVEDHQFHGAALEWFDTIDAAEFGLCRLVQLGLLRLLANTSIMGGNALSGSDAWNVMRELQEDERIEFLNEPGGIDIQLPRLLGNAAAPSRVTDAYIAAFAKAASRRLVTLDKGFKRFPGVDVLVL